MEEGEALNTTKLSFGPFKGRQLILLDLLYMYYLVRNVTKVREIQPEAADWLMDKAGIIGRDIHKFNPLWLEQKCKEFESCHQWSVSSPVAPAAISVSTKPVSISSSPTKLTPPPAIPTKPTSAAVQSKSLLESILGSQKPV
jgi:hypothetical protein